MTLLDEAVWRDKIFSGGWASGSGQAYGVREPATGDELGRVGLATAPDVSTAAEAALLAQRRWAAKSFESRAAVLRRAGQLMLDHTEELHGWIMRESGAIGAIAGMQTHVSSEECFEAAALASAPFGEMLRTAEPRMSFARRLPIGVVGVIAPFNVPMILAIRSVAPALALGNAVVLKPDPRTAVCGGLALARIFEEAGLPDGVFHVLPGGADVGEALVTDPRIGAISFTGSTKVGRVVGALAGQHLKRVHLELGGNSALIVLDDVDVEKASSVGAFGSFVHQGQICMTAGRHLVDARIVDEYVDRLAAHADHLPVGDPVTGQVALGPIIDEERRDRIHDMVTASVASGARLAAGGTYEGLFYRPTVLANTPLNSPAYAEEVFGPVAPVVAFSSLEEAAKLAADSEYGLSLGILSSDVMRGLALADQIPTGVVHINDQTVADEATIPFGGVKSSGTGARFGGRANLDAFTETQWVTVRGALPEYPF